ncbi:hypothetical protein Q1695_000087 [Nippostrongylus brasiliensis]|nr:hypothetical protein Q1695_000087 [Nippostrongylus brasiliensis]
MRFIATSSNADQSYENMLQEMGEFRSSTSIMFLCACVLSSLFTFSSNLLTAIVLVTNRSQHSISNLFIISLTIADMFIGVTMLILLSYICLISSFSLRFTLPWLCDAWQVTDFFLSTVSLYSICAIALDRVLNLEKPLHVPKRSRRLAFILICCVWVAPLLIWVPFYFTLTKHKPSDGENGMICATGYIEPMFIFIVSLFVFYIPSVLLIAMFARISMVVHKHFSFLRKHSNNPRYSPNSPSQRKGFADQTLNLKKDSSQTSGYGGLCVPTSNRLEVGNEERLPLCEKPRKTYGDPDEQGSIGKKSTREWKRSLRGMSISSRNSSLRISIIAFPAQLRVLLHKDKVSQQIRAARAVSLILACFLLCWLPFLILWPVKLYCGCCAEK